ncbi:acylglycerol lipase [Ilyonectria robusta]
MTSRAPTTPSNDHHLSALPSGASVHKWSSGSPLAIFILQHGFGEYAERYISSHSELIRKLNAKRIDVWAMDLWGHGSSPGTRGKVHVGKAVQDHIQLRHQAIEQGLPVFLFGLSLGGLVTAGSVTQDSSRVDGIILCSPSLPLPMLGQGAIGLLARLMPAVEVPKPRTPTDKLFRDAEQIRVAEADEVLFKGRISLLLAATALNVGTTVWDEVGQWRAPTLVIHGTSDVAAPVETSKKFVEEIVSSEKTLHLVEGGYHELLNDLNPDKIVQLILRWLEVHLD